MKQEEREMLLGAAKWCIIVAVAGIVFYSVFPKYTIIEDGNHHLARLDRITGQVDTAFVDKDGFYHAWWEIEKDPAKQ